MNFVKFIGSISVGLLIAQVSLSTSTAFALEGNVPEIIAQVKKKPTKKPKPTNSKLETLAKLGVTYKFQCLGGNTTALITTRDGKQYSPIEIIQWTEEGSKEFGDKYSPAARCKEVTSRFNKHFIKKGSIKVPPLKTSVLNKKPVVCASIGSCNTSNLLWTLKKSSAKNASAIITELRALIEYRGTASDTPIFQSDGDDNVVEMEDVIVTGVTSVLESEDPDFADEFAQLQSGGDEYIDNNADDIEDNMEENADDIEDTELQSEEEETLSPM